MWNGIYLPFIPNYYQWYDKITHDTIVRFKIRSNGRSEYFPPDLFICHRIWSYKYEVPEYGDGLPDTWKVTGFLYDDWTFMRVPEGKFIEQINDNLGKEQTLTSEQIMMYNISTKTGESSLFPGYKFTVRYEGGKYKLTITKKVEEEEECGRIPEKIKVEEEAKCDRTKIRIKVLPPNILSLKTGKSITISHTNMWKLFKSQNLVEHGDRILFYEYPDYTIKYNPGSNDYTITKIL